jgi:D-alanyl-D-alanine carboxypeptidase
MPRIHRGRRVAALACAAVVAFAIAACAPEASTSLDVPSQVQADLPADTQAQLQSAVDRAIAASGATGAVVGVWAPWAGTWLAGSGTVKPGGGTVAASATFKAGAVTRAMTCDVLYGLVKDGGVKLNDSVTTYVPGLPGHEAITLGDLCDSTSGLASYTPAVSDRLYANPERVWNPRELASYGVAAPTGTQPGTTFADSDTGYVLLGIALEHATNRSAEDLLEQYVFAPAGMTASALPTDASVQLAGLYSANTADGAVACSEPTEMTDLSPSAGYTASGVTSDLKDLGRYTQAMATGARAYDTDARFETPLPAAADAPSWFTAAGGAYQAGTLIGQYGSIPGYLTAAFADRNTGMTVVVVLNNSRAADTLVRSLAWQLAAIASKAPAASGQTAPDAGLPWTADDMGAPVTAAAVCPIP